MTTFATLKTQIENLVVLQDPAYLDLSLDDRINDAVSSIAAGIRMPDGSVSPVLPDLYQTDTVATTVNAYADLPATYQRNLFYVSDSNGYRIAAPTDGGYYDFVLFLNGCYKKDLSETGTVYVACVKGSKIYYQGIPSASANLTVNYYRKPVDMSADDSTPDGIPDHLQSRLIKHYVARELFGETVKIDKTTQFKLTYHENEFYKAMQDLIDFVGENDNEPMYYGGDNIF